MLKFTNKNMEPGRGFSNIIGFKTLLDPREGFVSADARVLRLQVRIIKDHVQTEGLLWPCDGGVQTKTDLTTLSMTQRTNPLGL